jgi:hypothetical protein
VCTKTDQQPICAHGCLFVELRMSTVERSDDTCQPLYKVAYSMTDFEGHSRPQLVRWCCVISSAQTALMCSFEPARGGAAAAAA